MTTMITIGVINICLAIGIFLILGKKLGGISRTFVHHIIDVIIRNKELRSNIFKKLDEIEENLGGKDGALKMDIFSTWAGKVLPGDLDDKIIRQICQGIYDGWKLSKEEKK